MAQNEPGSQPMVEVAGRHVPADHEAALSAEPAAAEPKPAAKKAKTKKE